MSIATINPGLIEKVEGAIYIYNDEWSIAVDAIRAVGKHFLSELEGSESPCEMRAKIAKECGLQ